MARERGRKAIPKTNPSRSVYVYEFIKKTQRIVVDTKNENNNDLTKSKERER